MDDTASTSPQREFNPKPDTAEGVGELLASTRAFVEEHLHASVIELISPDGVAAPAIITDNGVAVMPANSFDGYRTVPRRRTGAATLLDLQSFIDHTNRFKDPDSVVFVDTNRDAPSLTSVLDYHRAGADSAPRWGEHRGKHAFPLSDEWKDWKAMDGTPMEMPVFAKFLDDHITDVLGTHEVTLSETQDKFVRYNGGVTKIAEPARLVEISRDFRVHEATSTANAYVTQTGEAVVNFENRHVEAGANGQQNASVALPSMFAIGIPVFRDGEAYQLLAQFRYRTGGGKVLFFYDLWRADLVFDHAIEEAIAEVIEQTGLPVFRGKPE